MKLINQSHEILNESNKLKLIELCGRVCYKSESKITTDSASSFVSRIVRSGHWSVLEHASIAFEINEGTFWWIRKMMPRKDLIENYVNDDSYLVLSNLDRFVVSGNFRAWKEYLSIPNVLMNDDLRGINYYLAKEWPEIFADIVATTVMVKPLEESEMSLDERILHKRISVRFITNRGAAYEALRHREDAWLDNSIFDRFLGAVSQESTRYVNYKNSEMEFIKPVWMDNNYLGNYSPIFKAENQDGIFIEQCLLAELSYNNLISSGWRPEMAREVLPNALKTEIVMTASLREWYHVMRLRTSNKAHPQIRSLMTGLLDDLISIEPKVFGDLKY